MNEHKFPASRPRKLYWSDEVGGCASCPDCDAPLEAAWQTYMMVTRQGGETDAHMVGNTAGHFCSQCPVVVFDRDEFERFLTLSVDEQSAINYTVLGIVDLDAVPEDKRDRPFDDTNPIPLVEFTNLRSQQRSGTSPSQRQRSKKRKKRKKKR